MDTAARVQILNKAFHILGKGMHLIILPQTIGCGDSGTLKLRGGALRDRDFS